MDPRRIKSGSIVVSEFSSLLPLWSCLSAFLYGMKQHWGPYLMLVPQSWTSQLHEPNKSLLLRNYSLRDSIIEIGPSQLSDCLWDIFSFYISLQTHCSSFMTLEYPYLGSYMGLIQMTVCLIKQSELNMQIFHHLLLLCLRQLWFMDNSFHIDPLK